MNLFLLFTSALTAAFGLGILLALREARMSGTSMTEEFGGICAAVVHRTAKKQANLDKVMKMFEEHYELSNFDIRKKLKVSRNTVVRYMNELEKEGKIEQVGTTGYAVVYRQK